MKQKTFPTTCFILLSLVILLAPIPCFCKDSETHDGMDTSESQHRPRHTPQTRAGKPRRTPPPSESEFEHDGIGVINSVLPGGRVNQRSDARNDQVNEGLLNQTQSVTIEKPSSDLEMAGDSAGLCAPRNYTVKIHRHGCQGSAVLSVCQGACAQRVVQKKRSFPFVFPSHELCFVKEGVNVNVDLVCSERFFKRLRQIEKKELPAPDDPTWNWMVSSKVLMSAKSCECKHCWSILTTTTDSGDWSSFHLRRT